MWKLGLGLLYATFTQIILVITAYQFYFRYAQTTGGVQGSIMSNVHPAIWIIIIIELIIVVRIIDLPFKKRMDKIMEYLRKP